eukprot:13686164-Ditylum_brightwellii.AAC.1
MFSWDQIKEIILACFDDDKPQQRLMGVGIGISCYGLLQKAECLKIMVENVQFSKELNRYQFAATFVCKQGVQPVSYHLPEYMNKGMRFYLGEFKVPK